LTNQAPFVIIQSQVEGNRTGAKEGKDYPKGDKMVTKNLFREIEKSA
jgi:hypothetical protein